MANFQAALTAGGSEFQAPLRAKISDLCQACQLKSIRSA